MSSIACGQGGSSPTCTGNQGLSTVVYSGFTLPTGVSAANVTQVFGFTQATNFGVNGAGQGTVSNITCAVPGQSPLELINEQTVNFTVQPFSGVVPGATGSNISSITCTASVDNRGDPVTTGLSLGVNVISLVVYYTGTQVLNPNVINIAPPLSYNSANSVLGLSMPYDYAPATDSSDAYAVSGIPLTSPFLSIGTRVIFTPPAEGNNATTTPTLNVDGTGPITIVKVPGHTPLAANDIQAGCTTGSFNPCVADVINDGSFWVLQNPATGYGSSGSGSISVNGASVSSPNLNGTTPAAPSGSTNCTWAVSGSSVSCSVPTSSGSAITALTEDVTASGTGSVAATAVNLPGHIGLTGTPSVGQVPTATSPTAATWQTPSTGSSVNVNGTAVSSPNFNGTIPAAPTNGINVVFAQGSGGTLPDITAAIIGDGAATDFLNGQGVFTTPAGSTGGCSFSTTLASPNSANICGALNPASTGHSMTVSGASAGQSLTGGVRDSFYGSQAGQNCTSCDDSDFFGQGAGFSVVTGTGNTAVGGGSGDVPNGADNTSIGFQAQGAGDVTASGSQNTAVGSNAGFDIEGTENNAFGFNAMQAGVVTGNQNDAYGWEALQNLSSGSDNDAVGERSMLNLTTGSQNSCIGSVCLFNLVSGNGNTALGEGAGFNSSVSLQTISDSVYVGGGANSSTDGVTNQIVIGFGAQGTASNQTVLGNSSTTQVIIPGTGTGCLSASSGGVITGSSSGCGTAPLASPAFTGIPTAPTAAASTNTTQLATTAFVTAALAAAGSAAGIVTYSGPSLTFTGTAFFPIGGGGLSSTTETNVDLAAPATATVKNFTVQLSVAPGTGNSIAFTWRDNAASTAITCTVSGSATSCSDLTHSFTAAAGDLLDIQAVTSGTIISASTAVMGTQIGIAASGGGGVTPQTVIASNSADMEFTSCITSAQKDYQIRLSSIILATANQDLQIQFSTNGGSTWDTSADYDWTNLQGVVGAGGAAGNVGATGANGILLTGGGGGQSGTPFPVNATLTLHDPLNAASFKFLDGTGNRVNSGPTFVYLAIGGIYTSNTAVNAFRVISTSGNITSGQGVCQPLAQ
jgi:hypothetical protein